LPWQLEEEEEGRGGLCGGSWHWSPSHNHPPSQLSQTFFLFNRHSPSNQIDKRLGKALGKRTEQVSQGALFAWSVAGELDVLCAATGADCLAWCQSITTVGDAARGEPLTKLVEDAKSRVMVLKSQISRHEQRMSDDGNALPKSEKVQLKSQIVQLTDELGAWSRKSVALHKQLETVRGGRRAGSAILGRTSSLQLDGRKRSSSIGTSAGTPISPRNQARMFGQVVDVHNMTDAELEMLVAEKAGAVVVHDAPPAPSGGVGVSASKLCQRCKVHKAVAKVRISGSSDTHKLCRACLDALQSSAPGDGGGGGARATPPDQRGAQLIKDAPRREGMMAVGNSRKQYLVVVDQGELSWYESKKSLEATCQLPLADAVCDSFGDLLFVQCGDTVYDFQCKSAKEVQSWLEFLAEAAAWARTVDQRQPLTRYKQRSVYPVRLMLKLPTGVVQVVCNTKHTPEQAKQQLFDVARQRGLLDGAANFCAPDFYFLKYAGFDRILIDEFKPFSELPFINLLRDSFAGVFLVACSKPELVDAGVEIRSLIASQGVLPTAPNVDTVSEIERERAIQSLIDDSLWHSLAARSDDGDAEINVVRCRMARFRMRAFAEIRDRLPEFINSVPRPTPCPASLQVTCQLPDVKGQKTVQVDVQLRPSQLRDLIFGKMTQAAGTSFGKRAADFVLKVLGFRSYFISEVPFIEFDYVRTCINRGRRVELSLVEFDQRAALENEPLSVVDAALSANLQWIGASEHFVSRTAGATPAADGDSPLTPVTPRTPLDGSLPDEDEAAAAARRGSGVDVEMQFRVLDPAEEVAVARLPAEPFVVTVSRLSGCRLPGDRAWGAHVYVFAEVSMFFGGILLCPPQRTPPAPFDVATGTASFASLGSSATLSYQVLQSKVPKGARVCLTVYACAGSARDADTGKAAPIGWVGVQCFDWNERLVQGEHQRRLWPGAADAIGTCTENFTDKQPTRLLFAFRRFAKIAVYTPPIVPAAAARRERELDVSRQLLDVIERDSLEPLSETIKPDLWRVRWCLRDRPRALAKLLQCVRWWEPADVAEAHAMVREWRALSSTEALELFDARYADPVVRAYAVERLATLSDGALVDLLLQLVQVLKYEPYHDSPLSRFLVRRALQAKDIVGYPLFWHLRSEAHVPEISQRFLLLTEAYLRGCGRVYRQTLIDQVALLSELNYVGQKLVVTEAEKRPAYLRTALEDMRFAPRFSLPLFTDYECSGLMLDKCRHMKSKKMPLWLTFNNADQSGSPVTVMFKVGDDLRQDVLTLQMIKLMDKLWTAAGMNLGMSAYGVVATGPERGLVEVVLNSETMANINRKAGGALQVFNPNVLADWLREQNPTDEAFAAAQRRFALSAAGYAVATYVLGVGDRHNDNIMLNKSGAMFHIDFGHFLGHFKTKWGYEREKAPFVFTKQYAQILGGRGAPAYELFVETACRAYLIVRRNAMLFINLFTMMISVGLPELQSRENVVYLRDMLVLQKSDADATLYLKALIDESLRSFNTQVGEVIHIAAN
jgi:hypothetical protein